MKKIIIPNQNLKTKIDTFETRVTGAGGVVLDKNRMFKTMLDFQDASILFTPNGYRATRLQNVVPNTTAGDFAFNRNSQAGIINSAGTYELVANNIPRLDWKTGKPALLNEQQSTNLCFPSDIAVTQDVPTLLDVVSRPHWLSFVGTGSVTVSGSGTGTLNGTGVNDRVFLDILCATGTATLTVAGDVREIQFERGWLPTSYIPTVGSALTRLAENTRITGISSLIGQTEGTYYCEFELTNFNTNASAGKTLLVGQTNNNRQVLAMGLAYDNANLRLLSTYRNESVSTAFTRINTSGAPTIGLGYHKVIYKFSNQTTGINLKIFHNGVLAQNTTTTLFLDPLEALDTFRVGGESQFFLGTNDRIFKSAHWNYGLSDSKCQRLTTIL